MSKPSRPTSGKEATGKTPSLDADLDETMAMVYVGDVYSLVAQEGVAEELEKNAETTTDKPLDPASRKTKRPSKQDKNSGLDDGPDALWPYIR